ncbi:MAG: hypothetical protein ABSG60_11240 [Terracidiphilus sp.]
MKSKMQTRFPVSMAYTALSIALLVAAGMAAAMAGAQTPANFGGTITAINGSTLTMKTDAGEVRQVDVPSTAAILRIAPGEKNLSAAVTIAFGDLASGDRVLVKVDPGATGPTAQALRIVAIKQSDLALKQQKDREDWQRRGVGGLVKSVDNAAGVIVLTSGIGAAAKTITVHTAKATVLKRYAPASVRYDLAQTAPIDAIQAGDQLQARGTKSADGTEIDAEEVVSGTFRNVSGVISSLDSASSTFTLKDLATKKQLTIHVTADAQMRRLPDMMARVLAARLKGTANGSAGGMTGNGQQANGGAGAWTGGAGSGQRGGSGQWASQTNGQGGRPGGDLMQMLSRAPAMQFADLQKGDAVMLVSTQGATEVTAITLLAGVEPLLEAPAASQNLLNNWSMGNGESEAAAVQ